MVVAVSCTRGSSVLSIAQTTETGVLEPELYYYRVGHRAADTACIYGSTAMINGAAPTKGKKKKKQKENWGTDGTMAELDKVSSSSSAELIYSQSEGKY